MRNGGVEDFEGWVAAEKFVADSLDKVGFAEAGSTIEEEGVVAGAWSVDDAFGGGDGEVVVATNNETIESVFTI